MRIFAGLMLSITVAFLFSLLGCVSTERYNELKIRNYQHRLLADSLQNIVNESEFYKIEQRQKNKDGKLDSGKRNSAVLQLQNPNDKVPQFLATNDDYPSHFNEQPKGSESEDTDLHEFFIPIKQTFQELPNAEVNVKSINGEIYLSLSQKLLFDSYDKKIAMKGKDVLKKLAKILQKNPDIKINVVGYTASNGSSEINWERSVQKAIAVAKMLTQYGVNPGGITTSGRSSYNSMVSNKTGFEKPYSLRTEIIISNNATELFHLIY